MHNENEKERFDDVFVIVFVLVLNLPNNIIEVDTTLKFHCMYHTVHHMGMVCKSLPGLLSIKFEQIVVHS
jgi:hypothetical protein